jgi:hypothetical protein
MPMDIGNTRICDGFAYKKKIVNHLALDFNFLIVTSNLDCDSLVWSDDASLLAVMF